MTYEDSRDIEEGRDLFQYGKGYIAVAGNGEYIACLKLGQACSTCAVRVRCHDAASTTVKLPFGLSQDYE